MSLQNVSAQSPVARDGHRPHGVQMVAKGMSCYAVSETLGHSPRTVEYWVKHVNNRGFESMVDRLRMGRPPRISEDIDTIDEDLIREPMISATGRPCGTAFS